MSDHDSYSDSLCLSFVADFLVPSVVFNAGFASPLRWHWKGLDCPLRRGFPKKVHQLSVHFVRVCPGYAVRPVFYDR